jgi:hypothetical protein
MVMVIEIMVTGLGAYLAVGVLAATALHLRGLRTIDPGVIGSGFGFRLLITPGLVALWPLMIGAWRRALRGATNDPEIDSAALRRRHFWFAHIVGVVAIAGAAAALLMRPAAPPVNAGIRDALPMTEAIGAEIRRWDRPFTDLPITLAVRSDKTSVQFEFDVAGDLEIPELVALWSPAGGDGATPVAFLGSVWGPGVRRFAAPEAAADAGVLRLHSIGWKRDLARFEYAQGGN